MNGPTDNPSDTPRPTRRAWIIILIGVLCSAFVLVVWWSHRTTFDSETWKLASANGTSRTEMADDLIRRYELVGMSRKQIDDLLGVPPATAYFSNYDYVYWLGPERGFISIDSEWLCIRFDNDTVVEARVMRD